MPIIGEQQVVNMDFKAGASSTVLQLVAPPHQPVKFKGWHMGFPNYRLPKTAPALGKLTLTVERQKGGEFANGGLPANRVSGGDRPGEALRAVYRSVPLVEPETVEVLDSVEIDMVSDASVDSDSPPFDLAPGDVIGVRITADAETDVRFWFLSVHHEE